jgi:hypothetical protein
MSTGESWSIVEDSKGRKRYNFPGGFAFVGLVYITKLREVKLPADGYRLALLVMEKAGYAGICSIKQRELAKLLSLSRPRITKLISVLEKQTVVQRIGTGCLLVNPTFCFRGTPAEQHKALELWGANRPFNLIKRRDGDVAA